MSQIRDTILPLCKLVKVQVSGTDLITLQNTGSTINTIEISHVSGLAFGATSSVSVSNTPALAKMSGFDITSATADITCVNGHLSTSTILVEITNAGKYTGECNNFGIQNLNDHLGANVGTDVASATGSVTIAGTIAHGQTVTIESTDGTEVIYTAVSCAPTLHPTGGPEGGPNCLRGAIEFGPVSSSNALMASSLVDAIVSAGGDHAGKITATAGGTNVVTLTQVVGGADGNNTITENCDNTTVAGFTGGVDRTDGGVGGVATITTTPALADVTYLSVTHVSGVGSDGFFRVFPASSNDFYVDSNVSSVHDGFMKGILGVSGFGGVMAGAGGTVTLTLQPSQSINSIHIENSLGGALGEFSAFAINYGVIKKANSIRDQAATDMV